MRRQLVKITLGVIGSLASLSALCGPMGFKESWMTMGDVSPNWQEVLVNYALTARDAAGASALVMRSDDSTKTRQSTEATYTRLVQRWNMPESQANIWFIGGIGNITGNDFSGSKTMASPGIQVDYETTRIYVSATARLYRAQGLNHDFASARAGFSFYEVDYDQTQPWFILEVRRMRGLTDKTEVTPMLRLIHNRYFVELGVNNASQARMNFMYIF
ncbi:MAG: hypothetical protein NWS01_03015 [Burkholderiales bacterium]|jgi:hypothetical protein|nr:hypothetical protein [Burkholderiales bacterium]